MKISATSALVLNWTDNRLYSGPKVKKYISSLDLSEGDEMLSHFKDDQNYMHTQTVSGRKWFMMSETTSYIEKCLEDKINAQVIIPGAGIAPFSAAIAELFPASKIWDIDLYSMAEKSILLQDQFNNISCLTADLEDVDAWINQLINDGYDISTPGIMILEGITYYLTKQTLSKIFQWAYENKITVIGEYGIPPSLVIPAHRVYPERVFSTIANLANHPGINFYTREEFIQMAKMAGYDDISITAMREMQVLRTGEASPFNEKNSCWIEPFRVNPD